MEQMSPEEFAEFLENVLRPWQEKFRNELHGQWLMAVREAEVRGTPFMKPRPQISQAIFMSFGIGANFQAKNALIELLADRGFQVTSDTQPVSKARQYLVLRFESVKLGEYSIITPEV